MPDSPAGGGGHAHLDRPGPPYRVEHVGSFVRPENLLQAARAFRAGDMDADAFRRVQDDAVRAIVAFQEDIGLPSVTDGEFRRRGWSAGVIDSIDGFGLREGTLGFRDEDGKKGVAASPYAKEKLRRKHPIVGEDYAFLKEVVTRGVPKVTLAAPDVMHFFLGPRAVDEAVYPDIEDYYADLAGIYRDEMAELIAAGCRYVQFDDTAVPCNCDDEVRADVFARGEDPDALTRRYVDLFNDVVADSPDDMTIGVHMCRGNLKGAWMAEGGYEPIAEACFAGMNADVFLLEYDTPRSGDFEPLRFVSKGKIAALGLVSTKTPELEDEDDLKRRIDAASKHLPLDQLALAPQCGFSSVGGSGQVVTEDDTKRKLELIMRVAQDVWG